MRQDGWGTSSRHDQFRVPTRTPEVRWLPTSSPQRRERRIADGLRRGDEQALEALHEAVGRTVFGYLVQTLGDRGRAEDVFQQVLTEVWRRGDQFDAQRGSLLAWVMTITRSRAIDELRRRVPEPTDPQEMPVETVVDRGTDPDVLVERWTVADLLARLPQEEAELLRLRFHADLSQSEIAERTGLPLGTVKTRMVRGLRRLADLADDALAPAPAAAAAHASIELTPVPVVAATAQPAGSEAPA